MLLAVADFAGVSKSSASVIVKQVSVAIARSRPRYDTMPEGDARHQAPQKFYGIARFPFVIGAIDCTHVRIQSLGIKNNTLLSPVISAVKLLEIIIINYTNILLVF